MMAVQSGQSGFMQPRRHAQADFMQHISEQQSHRIALKMGRMRPSALNPGRVSAVMEPVPESLASPQGPVAPFYKESKMIHAAAKTHQHHHLFLLLFHSCNHSRVQPPPAPNLQSKGATLTLSVQHPQDGFAQRWPVAAGRCLEQGGGGRRDISAEEGVLEESRPSSVV